MDNKNVFIAIALSMSVLLFWGALFDTPKPINNTTQQQGKQKKTMPNSITPKIEQTIKKKKVSRTD